MIIGNCNFADDVLYDTESNTWVRFEEDGNATVGINAVLAWLGGSITSVSFKAVGTVVDLPWQEDDPAHLDRASAHEGRVMLAGGLDAANVAGAITAVRPWAVDSARSTEVEPGIKDHDAIRAWVAAAR